MLIGHCQEACMQNSIDTQYLGGLKWPACWSRNGKERIYLELKLMMDKCLAQACLQRLLNQWLMSDRLCWRPAWRRTASRIRFLPALLHKGLTSDWRGLLCACRKTTSRRCWRASGT